MNNKRLIIFFVIFALFIAFISTIKANEEIPETAYIYKVGSNNAKILTDSEENYAELDYPVIIKNSRSLGPVTSLLLPDYITYEVEYYAVVKTIVIRLKDEKDNELVMQVDSNEAYFNDEKFVMDVTPIQIVENKRGYTLIPIRYTYEPFGYTVEWNNDTREITVYK